MSKLSERQGLMSGMRVPEELSEAMEELLAFIFVILQRRGKLLKDWKKINIVQFFKERKKE